MNEQAPEVRTSRLKNIAKCAAFLCIFVIILMILSNLFTPPAGSTFGHMQDTPSGGFYAEPEDTIDVIGIGNSNMANGFSPMELWKQYGYTGYNCGVAAQIVFNSYTTLSDVFARQHPKAVILDADGFFPTSGHMNTFYNFTNGMMTRTIPLVEYHDRWKLMLHPGKPPVLGFNPERGYMLNGLIKPFSGNRPKPKSTAKLDTVTQLQLDMLNHLCEDNGAKLIFVYIPTAFSWNQSKHNVIAQYASSRGIPFFDLNTPTPGFSIDWKNNSRDGGSHLNYYGASRVTAFLGTYLHSHCSIEDRRGEPDFQHWNQDLAKYEKAVGALRTKPAPKAPAERRAEPPNRPLPRKVL